MNRASFSELGTYLIEQRATVMSRWKQHVQNECSLPASASKLTDEQLEDHLPALVTELAEALSGRPTHDVEQKASQHGHERRLAGFSLSQVICELRMFRRAILDALDTWLDSSQRSLSREDVRRVTTVIISLIDQSLSASAKRYAEDAEHERNIANQELAERTRQLEVHSKRLERLDVDKNRFLAMLSHELRNPIAPILSASYILKQAELAPQYVRSRDIIERQARHLARLVDDLLEVNRMLLGKIELRKERCDLMEAVYRAVEMCAGALEAKSISFEPQWDFQQAPIFADPTRIVQVLSNVLTNAAKFGRQGGHVWLSVERQGDNWICRLKDDGLGIAREALPLIFELFTQVDTSIDRANGGLGVGLSLARTLMEAHGGSIRAESEGLGKGATFILQLPALEQAELPAGSMPGLPRVAVVEDNPDSRLLMAEVLELKGFTVITAHDGVEALKLAEQERPQAFVIDLGLPGMNGYEVAKRIRRLEGSEQALLIALTGYGGPEDRKRAQQAGFDYHMTKPADFESLDRMLRGRDQTHQGPS